MAGRNKRIADFIESIPESKIESSTILFGGESDNPATPSSSNDRCDNSSLWGCIGSTNNKVCTNDYCFGSTNISKCSNTVITQNPSTDVCQD